MATRLSVVLITCNEERRMVRCLDSVRWADEIVVVDGGSTDRTVELAKRYTQRVFSRNLDRFDAQKNFGVAQATGDWILSIDADEVVTEELKTEIRAALARAPEEDSFAIPRHNIYFGRPVPHVMGKDEPVRLFKKEDAPFKGPVHEKINGLKTGRLNAPLMHFSCEHRQEWVEKHRRYVRLDAARQFDTGRRFSWGRFLFSPMRVFALRYFGLQGWKDGWAGLAIAWEMAGSTARLELMLRELNTPC